MFFHCHCHLFACKYLIFDISGWFHQGLNIRFIYHKSLTTLTLFWSVNGAQISRSCCLYLGWYFNDSFICLLKTNYFFLYTVHLQFLFRQSILDWLLFIFFQRFFDEIFQWVGGESLVDEITYDINKFSFPKIQQKVLLYIIFFDVFHPIITYCLYLIVTRW